jgi:hypothetical protein
MPPVMGIADQGALKDQASHRKFFAREQLLP